MEELWQTRIKDAFINLANFIESNKSNMPYNTHSVEFLTAVAMLRKAEAVDLKKSMREIVLGTTSFEGRTYSNVKLMIGLDNCGFLYKDDKGYKPGQFLKSCWIFRFVSKTTNSNGISIPITSEICFRNVIDRIKAGCEKDDKLRNELFNVWFHSASYLAHGFSEYINHYCTDDVSADDRETIKNKIPKECREIKVLGKVSGAENIIKLVSNITKHEYAKSMFSTFGVDPKMIEHFVGATKDNIGKIDVEGFKNNAICAAETGEIDGFGPILKNFMTTIGGCVPSIDDGEPDEQD